MNKKYKTVVLIGIDGAGEYIKNADIPNMRRIFKNNIKYGVTNVSPTISAQCWGSMFTGKDPSEHGLTNHIIKRERHAPDSTSPTFYRLLRERFPDINLSSICKWDPINFGIVEEHFGVLKLTGDSDRQICDKFCEVKGQKDGGLYFIHFDEVDDAGHESGFGSAKYYEKIHEIDEYIGTVYDYLSETGSLKDTLFIVTSDHGGILNNHGGDSDEERHVLFASVDDKGISYNEKIDNIKDIFKLVLDSFGYYDDMEKIKILLINGSPHKSGTTYTALHEIEKVFEKYDIDYETIHVGNLDIRGCTACGGCNNTGKCVYDDIVNEVAQKFKDADGLVVGSPVYYASANATLIALLDRMFYSSDFDKRMKVGASVCAARRGGLTATFDELNKYFTISGMPVASGQYWNGIHGANGAQALDDLEGCQMMRTLAENMVFLIRSIRLGKREYGLPEKEPYKRTNFIR